ncbi:hypothetical protein [Leclercia sp.]|uniref:hypothetical protein n=1 Tax=Leclercia sp. TaxID=1898428 RepID=UPI00289D30B3|nr:hypothetical protein [Leclercia sp.]
MKRLLIAGAVTALCGCSAITNEIFAPVTPTAAESFSESDLRYCAEGHSIKADSDGNYYAAAPAVCSAELLRRKAVADKEKADKEAKVKAAQKEYAAKQAAYYQKHKSEIEAAANKAAKVCMSFGADLSSKYNVGRPVKARGNKIGDKPLYSCVVWYKAQTVMGSELTEVHSFIANTSNGQYQVNQ